MERHGGDIYRNRVSLDFSININPLGIPAGVQKSLQEAIKDCSTYPDIQSQKLKQAIAFWLKLPQEYLIMGNGASELLMAVVHGLKPKKTVIPIPSFYGYEYAAGATGGEIIYYETRKEDGFQPGEDLYLWLTEEVKLLFLGNPNNPTGRLLNPEFLEKLLLHCAKQKIKIVVDESFVELCEPKGSFLSKIEQYEGLILIRSFTKSFAIPGVRLGYLICSHKETREKIERQLPEWNLSLFAQKAGVACTREEGFLRETQRVLEEERRFLTEGLRALGFWVGEGEANFLLFFSNRRLYEPLLEKGILIRDCQNFRGLSKGYYRIAIRTRAENEKLLKNMGEIM